MRGEGMGGKRGRRGEGREGGERRPFW